MIQPANVSSEDSNYSESREKSVRLEVRGLHLKLAEGEVWWTNKFLGLSELQKTITVKPVISLQSFLLLSSIHRQCNQIHSSSSCKSRRLLIDILWISIQEVIFQDRILEKPLHLFSFRIKIQKVLLRKKKECLQPCLLPKDLMKECRHNILFNWVSACYTWELSCHRGIINGYIVLHGSGGQGSGG